jgi:hypothetical protein
MDYDTLVCSIINLYISLPPDKTMCICSVVAEYCKVFVPKCGCELFCPVFSCFDWTSFPRHLAHGVLSLNLLHILRLTRWLTMISRSSEMSLQFNVGLCHLISVCM